MGSTECQCYYINPCQDPETYGGYVPSLVKENEPGHSPLLGRGEHSRPWIWGHTLVEAEKTCESVNAGNGLDQKAVDEIIASSVRAGK